MAQLFCFTNDCSEILVKIAHYYCLLFGKKLEGLVLSGRSNDFKSEFVQVKSI
jgi:hypothetical protein